MARGSRCWDWIRGGALLGVLVVLGIAGSALEPAIQPPHTGSELNSAGWEGRRLLAQFMWLKTEAVLHAGVEEREARPGEEKTRASEIHHHDGAGHEEAHVLAIPPRREDFRGVIGDLERAIKPYAGRDGRAYSKGEEQTLPFYRLITWADPHFVQGYTVGATMICSAGKHTDEALSFLQEGERANPQSFQIETEMGRFYLYFKHDCTKAEEHLVRAVAMAPKTGKLTDEECDARDDAYRWLALTYREAGKAKEAVRLAEAGIRVIGNDVTLRGILKDRGRS